MKDQARGARTKKTMEESLMAEANAVPLCSIPGPEIMRIDREHVMPFQGASLVLLLATWRCHLHISDQEFKLLS